MLSKFVNDDLGDTTFSVMVPFLQLLSFKMSPGEVKTLLLYPHGLILKSLRISVLVEFPHDQVQEQVDVHFDFLPCSKEL